MGSFNKQALRMPLISFMSVNLIFGINQEKVRKFGNYFGSIDFEVASTNRSQLKIKENQVIAGEFIIAGKRYKCTLDDLDAISEEAKHGECWIHGNEYKVTKFELERIVETCNLAKQVFFSKYRFGM